MSVAAGQRLVEPCVEVRESFIAAVAELVADGRAGPNSILGCWVDGYADEWHTRPGFEAFLDVTSGKRRYHLRTSAL